MRGEHLPELAAAGERQPGLFHRIAPARSGLRPSGKAVRQQGFELGADRLREHRRRAVGRNADHQRRAVDDGAEGKIAERRLVDDIDRHAGCARGLREGGATSHRPRTRRSRRWRRSRSSSRPGTFDEHDDAARRRHRRRRAHLVGHIARIDIDPRTRSRQQLGLPGRGALPPASSARLPSSARNTGSRASAMPCARGLASRRGLRVRVAHRRHRRLSAPVLA